MFMPKDVAAIHLSVKDKQSINLPNKLRPITHKKHYSKIKSRLQ